MALVCWKLCFALLALVFYICCTAGHKFSHPVCKALRLTRDISCCYLLSANNSKINLGYACQYSRSLPPSCFLYELHSHQTWLFETFITCCLSHKAKAGWGYSGKHQFSFHLLFLSSHNILLRLHMQSWLFSCLWRWWSLRINKSDTVIKTVVEKVWGDYVYLFS